jgi:hypothetical protein
MARDSFVDKLRLFVGSRSVATNRIDDYVVLRLKSVESDEYFLKVLVYDDGMVEITADAMDGTGHLWSRPFEIADFPDQEHLDEEVLSTLRRFFESPSRIEIKSGIVLVTVTLTLEAFNQDVWTVGYPTTSIDGARLARLSSRTFHASAIQLAI